MLAVQQTVPAVTGPGECAQTDGALDAGLVPGPLVHAQQEAVGDGRLAARAHFSSSSEIWTWWEHITATVTAKRPELVLIYKLKKNLKPIIWRMPTVLSPDKKKMGISLLMFEKQKGYTDFWYKSYLKWFKL